MNQDVVSAVSFEEILIFGRRNHRAPCFLLSLKDFNQARLLVDFHFFSGVGGGERKTSRLGVGLALLLAVRAPPLPRLLPTLLLLLCSRRCRSGSLFFLSAIALVNFLGVASPHRAFPVLVLVPRFVGNRYCVPYA
jgi:hypothetical protein